jgi:ubiquinone/menaquinone biosynthesis C-methylase UbiE
MPANPTMHDDIGLVTAERNRINEEYRRRAIEVSVNLYAQWQPSEILSRTTRTRSAARMLRRAGAFPEAGNQCLEIGFGSLGWLGDLIGWGLRETDLHGIELDPMRAAKAHDALPAADLRVGDATELPWDDNSFQMVVASTVFTSILDPRVRKLVAKEITRVLAGGGALLWYDFAVNNPRNTHVRKVDRKELKELFPQLTGVVKSITLAPPLARFIAPKSWVLATIFEAIPFLRTHLIGVLIKNS